jgi:hypothetical protein
MSLDASPPLYMIAHINDDDHVDGVTLRIWPTATKGPRVRPPGDIWTWRTIEEWYPQGKTDSSARALWQYYSSHLVSYQEELGEGNNEFSLRSIILRTWSDFVYIP